MTTYELTDLHELAKSPLEFDTILARLHQNLAGRNEALRATLTTIGGNEMSEAPHDAKQEEAREVQTHLDAGQDPELDKLVSKRADEWDVSRREALTRLLPDRAEAEHEPG